MMSGRRVGAAILIAGAILLLGFVSGWLAGSGYGNPWFDALAKPAFMPPGWAFPVAWTTLYILIGLALALVIDTRGQGRALAIGLFGVQFALNLAWSPLFFAAHRIDAAFVLIVAMIGVAAATAVAFWRIRRAAGWMMVPYLAWLLFAAALNYDIARLNPHA